jgi:hypothetical protein
VDSSKASASAAQPGRVGRTGTGHAGKRRIDPVQGHGKTARSAVPGSDSAWAPQFLDEQAIVPSGMRAAWQAATSSTLARTLQAITRRGA